MQYSEDDYLKALVKYTDLENESWLLQYFELYKSTLNWPVGLPPIARSNMIKGTLKEKFYSTYRSTLLELDHELDNEKQTLRIK